MAVGRLHAAVGLERSGRGVHERGTCPERVPERLTNNVSKMLHLRRFCVTPACNIPHLRTEARTDYRTHSRRARKGSNTHDTGHRKYSPCPRHPAPRGNVQGLVDHEDKV